MNWYVFRSRSGIAYAQGETVQAAKALAERNHFKDIDPTVADQADVAWLEKTGRTWVTR